MRRIKQHFKLAIASAWIGAISLLSISALSVIDNDLANKGISITVGIMFWSSLIFEQIMFWAFIVGNIIYYVVGIALAYAFKDNRAFCKYICPVTVFLKPMSYYSLLRVKCDEEKCVSCGKCKQVCPMDVDVTDNSRKRMNGTECILCMECVKNCPQKAL